MNNEFAIEVIEYLVGRFRKEAQAAGHSLSGKLMKGIEGKLKKQLNGATINFYAENYGVVLSQGVSSNRIPFGGTSKRVPGVKSTKTSKYIQGLQKYAQKRFGISKKEALSAAFAIAKKQKKVGMTIGSKGKGTKWIDKAINGSDDEVQLSIALWIESEVEVIFNEVLNNN